MNTIQIGDLKTHFSDVIKRVKNGNEIIITFGRKKENVAVIIPYEKYQNIIIRKIGILEGKATMKIHDDFEITEEELLKL